MAKMLKPGTLGYGLLVEQDSGYISPNDNKSAIEKISLLEGISPEASNKLYIYAVLQKAGVENRNGRVYPRELLQREVNNYQKLINEGRASGELNHPESSIIDLDRVSHRIVEVWWDKNTLMGKLEIMTSLGYHKLGVISCSGDRVADYLRQGMQIGISSRGVGSLKKQNGQNVVQGDFELICWDIVSSPSTPGSWVAPKEESLTQFVENEEKNKPLLDDTLDIFLGKIL